MIEFDNYKVKINAFKPTLETIHSALKLDEAREEIEKPEPRRLNNLPLRKLRKAFPEEMKKYEELRQEDPAAAKKLLMDLTERLNKKPSGK